MNQQQKIKFDDYIEHFEDPYFVAPDMERWINKLLEEKAQQKNKKHTLILKLINKLRNK